MVLVTEGRLRIDLDEGPTTLTAGAHAIYSSAQSYAYVNVHPGVSRFTRIVVA
jgi:hypothetical protein